MQQNEAQLKQQLRDIILLSYRNGYNLKSVPFETYELFKILLKELTNGKEEKS